MDFRILGPLAVLAGEEPVPLGGGTEQAVLAALVVNAGQTVATDRLVDMVWGDRAPDTAVKTLRSHVSRLRRRLEPWGAPIATTGRGYELSPDGHTIDAAVFEQLLETAQSQREHGGHRDAADQLRAALELWRGRALAGLDDHDFARLEAARLDELRLEAIEARIDSDLHLGRHEHLVADLETLVADYPFREALWWDLMLSLYRSGRQAAALRAYQRARTVLGEELGIEPGVDLRDLEEAILLQRPDIAAPPATARYSNLPTSRTSFIGREREVGDLVSLLGQERCVTITGTGGSGKTRLSTEAAHAVIADFGDGAVFVSLATISDPALVPAQVATALGDVGSHTDDQVAAIAEFLRPLHLLVVLDNCEHLVRAAAELVDAILESGPSITMLSTSREPLGAVGEAVFRIPPLGLPDPGAPLEEQEQAEAVRLYVDRVRSHDRSFLLDDANRAEVAAICRTLDGIPLAIELAAARTRAMTPGEILARMDDRFSVLVDGVRTAPPHQRTLQATIDWSYRLCPEAAQTVLRRLSVFAGGWSLSAAEAVVADDDLPSPGIASLLAALVDRSLVERTPADDGSRYHLLETIRQYAFDALVVSGEAPAVRARHRDWCLELAGNATAHLRGPDQVACWQRLEREHDNLRAAIGWSLESRSPDGALRLVAALGWFWFVRGYWPEAWRWAQRCLERDDVDPVLWAGVVHETASIEVIRGNLTPVTPLLDKALEICRTAGDVHGEAWTLHYQGHALGWTDSPDAIPLMERGRELFETLGDPWAVAWSWRYLGQVSEDTDTQIAQQQDALDRFFALGDRWNAAFSLYLLGTSFLSLGRDAEAAVAEQQALDIANELGDVIWAAHAIGRLGIAAYRQGDLVEATRLLDEGIAMHRRIGDENCVAILLGNLALVRRDAGGLLEAHRALVDALALWRKLDNRAAMTGYVNRLALVLVESDAEEATILHGAVEAADEREWALATNPFANERADLTAAVALQVDPDDRTRLMEQGADLGLDGAVERAIAVRTTPTR